MAGVSRLQYSSEIRLIRVMCTGRVDLSFIIHGLLNGADGVFIGGCHPGECNYMVQGNYHALNVVHLCKKIMENIGINPERLMIDWCNASEGIQFSRIMNDFSRKVRELGPLGKSEGIDKNELKNKIKEVKKLIPYIKMTKKEKLQTHLEKLEDYDGFFTSEEIETLFREVPSYYIDPEKCQACGICLKKCPVEAISGAKNQIHVIDQERCIKCGTCFESCPPRFGAIKKIVGEPAPPPPLPEDQRNIVRKGKVK
jgi:F420-non-reducing hydrogenase iron-sulfur subunit